MLHLCGDVGDDRGDLLLAVVPRAFRKHPHWAIVFANPVDPAGEVIFGTKRVSENTGQFLTTTVVPTRTRS